MPVRWESRKRQGRARTRGLTARGGLSVKGNLARAPLVRHTASRGLCPSVIQLRVVLHDRLRCAVPVRAEGKRCRCRCWAPLFWPSG